MEFLGYFRLAVLCVSTLVFSLLIRKLVSASLKGFRLVWLGFSLIILNLLVGSLFHGGIVSEQGKQDWLPIVGFLTGYVGQTMGMILIPVGIFKVVRVLIPRMKQTQAFHEQFVHSLDGIIYEIDPSDYRFTFVSKKCRDVLGYTSEEWLKSMTWRRIVHPDDFDHVLSRRASATREKRNHTIEFRALAADGHVVWLRDVASVIAEPGRSVKVRGVLLDITDHKRADQALRESEERLRTIINAEPQCVKLLASDGTILQMNPAGLGMLEAEDEECVRGGCVYPFLGSEYRDPFRTIVEQTFQGVSGSLRFEIEGLKGTHRWMETHAVPLRDADGKIIAALAIARDITEEKRVKEELQTKTAYFEQLFRKSPTGIVLLDTEDRIVDANESFQEMFQYPLGEIKGRVLNDLIAPERLLGEAENLSRQAHEGGTVAKETLRRRKDGSVFFVQVTGYPIAVNGRRVGIYGVYADISDRKRGDDVLRESEERYRSLIESARDVIFTFSPQGRITSLNQAFESGTGWTREEWLERSFTEIVHPEDLSKAAEIFSHAMQGSPTGIQDYRIKTKSGEYITAELTITRQIRDNHVVGLLGIARDVTARKQLEERLRQSQKMEGIGTLASGIAHDFNNILGIIMAYSSLLENPKSDDATRFSSAAAITKAVKRGARLVQQVLTLARKTEVSPRPVNPNDVVQELVKMIAETFPKTIEIVQQLDPSPPDIMIDSTQLLQCLLNLSVNARDAMMDKGIMTYGSRVVQAANLRRLFPNVIENQYVSISLADTGTGMDKQTVRRIFEPYFTTKGQGKGTGLGLAVVYGIVQAHNGFIDVESSVGHGTTFRLYFPTAGASRRTSDDADEVAFKLPRGTENILVAEDEELLLDFVKNLLESSGYKVIEARDGLEAITLYGKHREEIDLVLSDLGLPKLSGAELVGKMQALDPQVKVVLASGYFPPESRSDLQRRGIQEFVPKPYRAAEVLNAIRRALDDHARTPIPDGKQSSDR